MRITGPSAPVVVTPSAKASTTPAQLTTPLAPLRLELSPPAQGLADHLRARGFTGDILTSPADIQKYCTDYGKLSAATPRIVVKPKTQEDVQRAVQTAITDKTTIRTRSGGHALEGQSLSHDGIVISTEDLRLPSGNTIEIVGDRVRVAPGAHVGEVTDYLAKNGYRTRIVTMDSYPGVGGALSAAGTGRGSHKYGCMVDQVMRLTGVSPTGAGIDVSSDSAEFSHFTGRDSELANLMLGSFGQAGVITSAEVPIIKNKGEPRRFRVPCASLADLQKRMAEVIAKDDADTVAVWGFVAKDAKSGTPVYLLSTLRDVTDGSGEPMTSLPDPGADPHIAPVWMSVVTANAAKSSALLTEHPDLISAMTNPGIVLLIPQKKVRDDRLTLNNWSTAKTGAQMMGVGVFNYMDKDVAGPAVDQFRKLRAVALRDYAGQQYLTEGVPRASEKAIDEWKRIIGAEQYERVLTALDRADPYGVFERLPGLARRSTKARLARLTNN